MAVAMRTLVHSKADQLLHSQVFVASHKNQVTKIFSCNQISFFIFEKHTHRHSGTHTDTHTYNAQSQRKLVKISPIRVINIDITELYIFLII